MDAKSTGTKSTKATKASKAAGASRATKTTKTSDTTKPSKATKSAGTTKAGGKASRARSGNPELIFEKLKNEYGSVVDDIPVGDNLDLFVLAVLIVHVKMAELPKAFSALKSQFVDYNELRISSAKEVADALKAADEPLECAIALKDFLNRLFTERHHVGLDFVPELTLGELRSFFKRSPGLPDAAITLLLTQTKELGAAPLESWMFPCVQRLALVDPQSTPLQQQKDLFAKLGPERVLQFFSLVAEHARTVCLAEDGTMNCPGCVLKRACPHPKKTTARSRKKS